MKQILYLFIALFFIGFTACNTAPESAINTLTEEEIAEGWILLFDGETSKGWREYDNPTFPDHAHELFAASGEFRTFH